MTRQADNQVVAYPTGYLRKLLIWESNFGRDGGWLVELGDEVVAELVEPQFVDQFWFAYRIVPVANSQISAAQLVMTAFWDDFSVLTFRSQAFSDVVPAWPAATPLMSDGRVLMRGLTISLGWPKPWDEVVLWWRGKWKRR